MDDHHLRHGYKSESAPGGLHHDTGGKEVYCVAENGRQHSDEYDKHLFYVSYIYNLFYIHHFYNLSSPSGAASGAGSGDPEHG